MYKKQLIVTKLDNKEANSEHFFLGQWCFENEYINKNSNILNYHWNNRKKLKKDIEYINSIYEILLKDISISLNNHHNVNFSKKYWKILSGNWLLHYIGTIFDRWENIDFALRYFKNINFFYKNTYDIPIADNVRQYSMIISDSKWNHYIYSKIIEFLNKKKKINIFIKENFKDQNNFFSINPETIFHKLKKLLIFSYLNCFSFFLKKNKLVIHKSYMGLQDELLLNLKNKQIPNFFLKLNTIKNVDKNMRQKLKFNYIPKNLFEEFLIKNLNKNIPKDLVENYKEIGDYVKKDFFPNNPKVIFTTNSLTTDNIFTRYVADKSENGSKLICAQHGGSYGHIEFSSQEMFERSISNKFLTWGWDDKMDGKIIKFGVLKKINNIKFKQSKSLENVSYILRSRSKYTDIINSSTGSYQMCEYFENCLSFTELFRSKVNRINIVPRFHNARFEWLHEKIWLQKIPNLKIKYSNQESIKEVYNNYDLLIYSYLATGILESLLVNKPCLLVYSLNNYPLRSEEVCKDFDKLKEAKIFFESNFEALEHLNYLKREDNFYKWWNSNDLQNIRDDFCQKYALKLNKFERINKLNNILKKETI